MKLVKGTFTGSVVVLDEPAPLEGTVAVTVEFPEVSSSSASSSLPSPAEWAKRAAILGAVLEEWASDESGYDEEAWPELEEALERNRVQSGEYRSVFGDSVTVG